MLTVHQLSKSYGVQPLFQEITFSVNRGERVGLVGPNGCGKTTLLRIIAGVERADSGHVAISPDVSVGHLAQGFTLHPDLTLREILASTGGDAPQLEEEVWRLAGALAAQPEDTGLQSAYDRALHRLSSLDPGRVPLLLENLGLDTVDSDQPVGRLSGGQKTRLALALVLLQEPELLLLDEPTNHLDVSMLEWLEAWLMSYSGGVLLVSHDRTFLNQTVRKIIAMDPTKATAREYTGNYSDYVEQALRERERQWDAYREQQDDIRRMRQDIARIKQQAQRAETATKNDQLRRYAKKVARKAKSRESRLQRYMDDSKRVEKPSRHWKMKLDFQEPQHVGQDILRLEALAAGYDAQRPLLEELNLVIQGGRRVVLAGPNGSGKTTLLRTIAGHIAPLSGRVHLGSGVKLGYMTQEQTMLAPELSALEMIQRARPLDETSARSFLHYFLFAGDDPLRPSAELSYGERARLALALLVAQGSNFLLLDEPINHLDIPSRGRFEEALSHFEGTVLATIHDRYFIDAFATDIWSMDGAQIRHTIV